MVAWAIGRKAFLVADGVQLKRSRGQRGGYPILPIMGQQRPHDSGILVGQRHCGDIAVTSAPQALQPALRLIAAVFDMTDDGPGPMDQQGAQVDAPRLLIPSKTGLPPLECCRGTSPNQATKAVAVIGPMPGIAASRCEGSLW